MEENNVRITSSHDAGVCNFKQLFCTVLPYCFFLLLSIRETLKGYLKQFFETSRG